MSIADTLASVRNSLTECGVPAPTVTLAVRDQAQASYRTDLVSLGLDPAAEGVLEASLGGLVVGMKLMIQQNVPLPLVSQYVGVCECVLAMMGEEPLDVSELPDLDFLTSLGLPERPEPTVACSGCGSSDSLLATPWGFLCPNCAVATMRLSRGERPQIGGPDFDRGPEPRGWRDRRIKDLFKRGKHRKQ